VGSVKIISKLKSQISKLASPPDPIYGNREKNKITALKLIIFSKIHDNIDTVMNIKWWLIGIIVIFIIIAVFLRWYIGRYDTRHKK
jgi:lysozyme family protein